jgi:hypothetical protein
VAFGFASHTSTAASRLTRILGPDEWAASSAPLLHNPREVVNDLFARHHPSSATTVVAVFTADGRPAASASFAQRPGTTDGWEHRNAILAHLRRVLPHDLRLRTPVRTAVLLVCRDGAPEWTEADGAWMWGLRDACSLHGLRSGSYITLTPSGWRVLGDGRAGRTPRAGPWSQRAVGSALLHSEDGAPEAVQRQTAR